jgi:hypothetical protein
MTVSRCSFAPHSSFTYFYNDGTIVFLLCTIAIYTFNFYGSLDSDLHHYCSLLPHSLNH